MIKHLTGIRLRTLHQNQHVQKNGIHRGFERRKKDSLHEAIEDQNHEDMLCSGLSASDGGVLPLSI